MTGGLLVARWWQSRLRQALSQYRIGRRGIEVTLDNLADRLARTELALFQEERRHAQTQLRAQRAERDIHRLQAAIQHLRNDVPALFPEDAGKARRPLG